MHSEETLSSIAKDLLELCFAILKETNKERGQCTKSNAQKYVCYVVQ